MALDLTRAVLLPIDMQQAFDGPSWPPRWNAAADESGRALLAGWRRAGRPVIHVRHDSLEPGSTLRPGLPGHAFRRGFEPLPGEPVVGKSVNAAFIGTDLDQRLRRLDAGPLVIFGLSTDMCVSTSVRVAANLGWRVVLAADACDCFELPDGLGGRIPAREVHRAHVATLAFEFCRVAACEEILAALAPRHG